MRGFGLLFAFLLVYIEIAIFIKVAAALGILLTLLLLILSSCLGVSLVRSQGIITFMQLQQKLASGENPTEELVKSVSLLIAGFLSILPGFLSDFFALLLLLPVIQRILTLRLMPYIRVKQWGTSSEMNSSSGRTIEGEFKRKDDQ